MLIRIKSKSIRFRENMQFKKCGRGTAQWGHIPDPEIPLIKSGYTKQVLLPSTFKHSSHPLTHIFTQACYCLVVWLQPIKNEAKSTLSGVAQYSANAKNTTIGFTENISYINKSDSVAIQQLNKIGPDILQAKMKNKLETRFNYCCRCLLTHKPKHL